MKIAVLDDIHKIALKLGDWDRVDADVSVFHDPIAKDALVDQLRPFDVVCLMRELTPMPKDVIDALPNLKLIVTTGRRNASIDVAAAAARNITVCGTESDLQPPAHHAITLMLAASRGILTQSNSMRDGGWQTGVNRDVYGLTLGLVGLGRLGSHIAKLIKPFGVRVIAYSPNLDEARAAAAGVTRMESLEALLGEADIVSLHLVLNAQTRGLFNASALACMKPDALLVNTSRGPIIETAPLLDALKNDRLGAAALDVFEEEPLPKDHPLRDRELIDRGKLLLTPHIGYVVEQTYRIFYQQTVEDVLAWQDGAPIRCIMPPK